jgi:hypothetical protein
MQRSVYQLQANQKHLQENQERLEQLVKQLLLHRSEDHNKTSSKDVDVVAILPLTNKEQYMLFVEKLDDKDFKRNVVNKRKVYGWIA